MKDKIAPIHHNCFVERYAELKTISSRLDYSAGVELASIILRRCRFKAIYRYRAFKSEYRISIAVKPGELIVSFNECSNNNNVIFGRVGRVGRAQLCWSGCVRVCV